MVLINTILQAVSSHWRSKWDSKIHSCTIDLNIVSLAMVFILLRWILHAVFDCFVAAITVVYCFGHNFNMLKNTLPIHL